MPQAARRRAPSLKSGSSSNDRLEPALLRAVETKDLGRIKEILQEAQNVSYPNPHFLDIGLARACDRNIIDAARLLLSRGANPNYTTGNKLLPLRRAAESGCKEIVETLLDHGADPEACDKKKRTALMTAAWKDHFDIVKLLLERGANIRTVDERGRNALHNIAADKSQRKCSMEIVELLFRSGIDIEARDGLERTALHWVCVTDHELLLRRLLAVSPSSSDRQIQAVDGRMKTPLHFAVSNNREHLAKILLENGAAVMARSDGGWTSLHNACEIGSLSMVKLLHQFGADENCELLNGRTPLHIAAEHGRVEVARYLLDLPDIRRSVKDRFGNTPLLIAAHHGQRAVAEMLAPWNHLDALSTDELEAAKQFRACIVDFGDFRNGNKVTRPTVYNVLYARDSKDYVSTVRNVKTTQFRWIHLPVNNIAWCDSLLTKRFIEEEARDVEGYKALEVSFSHQHRGHQPHARFMRPMCQAVNRTQIESEQPETPAVVVHEPTSSPLETPEKVLSSQEQRNRSGTSTPKGNNTPKTPGRRESAKTEDKSHSARKDSKPKPGAKLDRQRSRAGSPSRKHVLSNIYFFMPYLHFETEANRQAMRKAMERSDDCLNTSSLSQDEILMRAHLSASRSFLHVRRTLDQFFYHNVSIQLSLAFFYIQPVTVPRFRLNTRSYANFDKIDTDMRDCNQVVLQFQRDHKKPPDRDPKLFMVDQLWMWVLGKDLVVTSFPQRWRQPRNDPLNVLEGIIEDINSKTREPVQNVFELAMTIVGRCFGTFDRHRKGDEDFQFLDMFEASIGNAMDAETKLFREFSNASEQASAWLKKRSQPAKLARKSKAVSDTSSTGEDEREPRRDPEFVDRLLDVGPETHLLSDIREVREELAILKMVLDHQKHLLPELRSTVQSIYQGMDRSALQITKVTKSFEEQEKTIDNPLKDIDRMDEQAERVYISIRDLLDLKQKHANAFEARFARDQATGTVRQGRTIMVFTVVTVVFLPLSFIAALFAINISNFPHRADGQVEMSLSFVSAYTFGIGLAISIPLILIALSVDELGYGFDKIRKWIGAKRRTVSSRGDHEDEKADEDALEKEQIISKTRSWRKSVENNPWNGKPPLPLRQETNLTLEERSSIRRVSRSFDVERGMQY